jgi:hypothetical protein
VTLNYSIEFHNNSLKKKSIICLSIYCEKKARSNYNNFKAYDYYLSKLLSKFPYPVSLETKACPLLSLCFSTWKHTLMHRKQKLRSILLGKRNRIYNYVITFWKDCKRKNALDSIFRDLESILKSSCNSVTQKKVRFNV